tara:strand:+ start:480 stop:1487 length:1008 start_codon:yes stop_codon:yes gene_type:complete
MFDCNKAWETYCDGDEVEFDDTVAAPHQNSVEFPKCSKLYISTTTKISHLSGPINLETCFWNIPIISYTSENEGVVKKQIKYTFKNPDEVPDVENRLQTYPYYMMQQISYVDNKTKMIYKDIRKINVGIAKKDVTSGRSKLKSAFYNCFVLIIRVFEEEVQEYKEAHVKVFNTGKLELPGIKSFASHIKILNVFVEILNRSCGLNLHYMPEHETVLINSNFKCGYFINREKLTELLKSKYNIETSYDPCSYPGIMSKVKVVNTVKKLSFMIFRTGSVLIVGRCRESVIFDLYDKLKQIFEDEYCNISVCESEQVVRPKVVKNTKRKYIKVLLSNG